MKKITRTWTTKKGVTKTKTYKYDQKFKSRKSKTLVSKSGKINKKNVQDFKDEIMNSSEYNDAEKRTLINDLNIIVRKREKDRRKLTVNGFLGEISDDAIDRMFANAGASVEEIAEWYDLDEADIRDKKNWSGDVLTIDKKSYRFSHNYNAGLLEAILIV